MPIFLAIITLSFFEIKLTLDRRVLSEFLFVFLGFIPIMIAVETAGRFVGPSIFRLVPFELFSWLIYQRFISRGAAGA